MTVVGVAADVRFDSPDHPARPMIYRPHAQHPWKAMTIVLRTAGAPADVVPGIRAEVKTLWGNGGIFAVREFTFYLSRSLTERWLLTTLVWSFAGVALVLALVGVYGVFAYAVTSRTREIGVRIALGSPPARLVWMMMRQACALASLGLATGAAGVFLARRLIETQLLQLRAMDAPTLLGVSITVLTTALVACYLPARRVARIDPTTALRAE
jgi:putative ABC transport system permease protein